MEWLSRLIALLRSKRLETEYDDELSFHLEMKERDNLAAGMTPERARREAALHFGNQTRVREQCRESNGFSWVSSLLQDLLYGVRSLRKDPAFTVTALLALTLGIGVNTAIFTVIRGVMLLPLPLPKAQQIVMIRSSVGSWSPKGAYELARNSRSVESLAAFTGGTMALTGNAEPRQLWSMIVAPSFFTVLGVKPALGRPFTDREAIDGSDGVVILNDEFWRAAFHAHPAVIGREITLDGRKRTVIGVLPPLASQPSSYWFGRTADIVIPAVLDPNEDHNAYLQVVARLKTDFTAQQAQAELSAIDAEQDRFRPANRRGGGIHVVPLQQAVAQDIRTLLLVLLGAVALVLLIACANIANLLLARAGARRREMAVRASLGASRPRLIRQLLTESVLLSGCSGLLGIVLCYWTVPLLLRLAPAGQIPRIGDIRVDGAVLFFSLALSLLTGVVFGLAPSVHATRMNMARAGRSRNLRGFLVAAEVALTLVLLAGAGLLLKSFYRMMHFPTGFEREHILTVTVALPDRIYTTTVPMRRFYESVLERVRSLPGVESAGMVSSLPLGIQWFRGDFTIEGQRPNDWMVGKPNVSADYFRTMAIPLLRGRFFDAHDTNTAQPVAIITESIARRFWGDRDPIGSRLTLDDPKDGHWLSVVGVVGDIKQEKLASHIDPQVYVPFQQEQKTFFMDVGSFVIRTRQDASSVAEAVRKQIQTVDPDLPIYETATVQELVDRSAASPRFETRLLTAFAALALVLASIGIYGVAAYGVSQRTHEIGVRRALGAGKADILRIVMGGNLRYVFAGLTLGIAGAVAVTRVLATFLYEVEPRDPLVLFLAPVLLSAIALLASYLPARKAVTVQPSVALRYE